MYPDMTKNLEKFKEVDGKWPLFQITRLRRFDTFDCHKVVFAALTAFTVVFFHHTIIGFG